MKAIFVCGTEGRVPSPDVWSPYGIKILGTLLGCAEFEEAATDARLEEEEKL